MCKYAYIYIYVIYACLNLNICMCMKAFYSDNQHGKGSCKYIFT